MRLPKNLGHSLMLFRRFRFCLTLLAVTFVQSAPSFGKPFINTSDAESASLSSPSSSSSSSSSSEVKFKEEPGYDTSRPKHKFKSICADLVFTNGSIFTVDAARSWAQALAVSNGKIVFVGSDAQAKKYIGAKTKVFDLNKRMVLPGFHDTHVHLSEGGVEINQVSLEGISNVDEIAERIKSFVKNHPKETWIQGGNWALTLFPKANPKKEFLDAIEQSKPIFLISADGHSAWANSKAISLAGLSAATPDPPLGRIERAEDGQPSGTFREAAIDLVRKVAPPVSEKEMLEGTRQAIKLANSFGITSAIEANASEDILRAYRSLQKSNDVTLKLNIALSTNPLADVEQIDQAIRLRKKYSKKDFRVSSVKFFADGVVESHTAALLEPYSDGVGGCGFENWESRKFARLVTDFDRNNFQIHIHAIGDRAVRSALDAIEAMRRNNGELDNRPHIAHLQLVANSDLVRFRKLNVAATFQPLWAYRDAYVKELTEPLLGAKRTSSMYPIASFVQSGTTISAGSDWTVSSLNPLDAIEVAVTRRAPGDKSAVALDASQAVSLKEIIAAYTIGGAYVGHSDQSTGSLEVGKAADLIVLDSNLFDIEPSEIHKAKVDLTLLNGKTVYDRAAAAISK